MGRGIQLISTTSKLDKLQLLSVSLGLWEFHSEYVVMIHDYPLLQWVFDINIEVDEKGQMNRSITC